MILYIHLFYNHSHHKNELTSFVVSMILPSPPDFINEGNTHAVYSFSPCTLPYCNEEWAED